MRACHGRSGVAGSLGGEGVGACGGRVRGGAVAAARTARSTGREASRERRTAHAGPLLVQEGRRPIHERGSLEPAPVPAVGQLELGLRAESVPVAGPRSRRRCRDRRSATGSAPGSAADEAARRGAPARRRAPSDRGAGSRVGCPGRSPRRPGRPAPGGSERRKPQRVVKPIVSSPTRGVLHARATRCQRKPGSSGTVENSTRRSMRSGKRWASASATPPQSCTTSENRSSPACAQKASRKRS